MNEPANFGTNLEKPWNWPTEAKPYWSLKCPSNNRYEDPPYRTSLLFFFFVLYNSSEYIDNKILVTSKFNFFADEKLNFAPNINLPFM